MSSNLSDKLPFFIGILFSSIVPSLILSLLICQISTLTFVILMSSFYFSFFPFILFFSIFHLNCRFSFDVKLPFCPLFFSFPFFVWTHSFFVFLFIEFFFFTVTVIIAQLILSTSYLRFTIINYFPFLFVYIWLLWFPHSCFYLCGSQSSTWGKKAFGASATCTHSSNFFPSNFPNPDSFKFPFWCFLPDPLSASFS